MGEQQPPKARGAAWRGALKLLAGAGRAEGWKLDKASKLGLIIDPEQRAVLAWLVDQLTLAAIGEGEEAGQHLLGLVHEQVAQARDSKKGTGR
jgi:hypothetical protein